MTISDLIPKGAQGSPPAVRIDPDGYQPNTLMRMMSTEDTKARTAAIRQLRRHPSQWALGHHLLGAKTRPPRKIGAKIIHHQTPGAGGPPVTKEGGPIHPAGSMSHATQSGVSDGGRQCQPDPPRWPSHNTGVTKAMPTQNRRRHVSGSTPIRDETAEASAAPRWAFRNRLAAKNGEPKEDYEGHQEGKECRSE